MAAEAPLPGRSSAATTTCSWRGHGARALLHRVGRAERAVPRADLLLGLVRERRVDDVQQRVVLPHAEGERRRDHGQADDQPRAQLLEVVDHAEVLLVPDPSNGDSHARLCSLSCAGARR